MHEFTVRPRDASKGWVIELGSVQPMRFLSGAIADATVRKLVKRLADAGQPARARVLLRDGSIGGTFTAF